MNNNNSNVLSFIEIQFTVFQSKLFRVQMFRSHTYTLGSIYNASVKI